MAGYFLDYLKYVVTLLPLSSDALVFMHVKLPFMFFLGLALPVYCGFVLFGIVMLFQNEQQRLQQAVRTDSLTGLYNRLALQGALGETSESDRFLAMLDIDNFKAINDTYGHTTGDEFCVLCQNDSCEAFIAAMEQVKSIFAVRSARILGNQGATLSVGIARQAARQPPQRLFSNADKALYESKNAGKDQIRMFHM